MSFRKRLRNAFSKFSKKRIAKPINSKPVSSNQITRASSNQRIMRAPVDSGSWTRTQISKSSRFKDPNYAFINGVEHFKGRPILGRDMKINGGIYLGANQREAIVVDRKYGKLNELFNKANQRLSGKANEGKVLKAVFDVVSEAFPIKDNAAVERLIQERGVQQDGKIALDVFISEGKGVCRHNALAAADLLQHFAEKGVIKGKASVDRNTRPVNIDGVNYEAGHAWCRYTASSGEVIIIDTMHGKIKKLKETELADWDYRRVND